MAAFERSRVLQEEGSGEFEPADNAGIALQRADIEALGGFEIARDQITNAHRKAGLLIKDIAAELGKKR